MQQYSLDTFISISKAEGLSYLRRYNRALESKMRSGNQLDRVKQISLSSFPFKPDKRCILYVAFKGSLTGVAAHEFNIQLKRISDKKVRGMILDFRKVDMICSDLIRLMEAWAYQANKRIPVMSICCYGLSPHLLLSLETFGFNHKCPLVKTLDDAKYEIFTKEY